MRSSRTNRCLLAARSGWLTWDTAARPHQGALSLRTQSSLCVKAGIYLALEPTVTPETWTAFYRFAVKHAGLRELCEQQNGAPSALRRAAPRAPPPQQSARDRREPPLPRRGCGRIPGSGPGLSSRTFAAAVRARRQLVPEQQAARGPGTRTPTAAASQQPGK